MSSDLVALAWPVTKHMVRFLFPPWTLTELCGYVLISSLIVSACLMYERYIMPKKQMTVEGIFFSMFLSRRFSRMLNPKHYFSFSGLLCGLLFAGLERFLIGLVFHSVPAYTIPHEHYHNRLRKRKLYGERLHSDDLHEIVSYLLLFWTIYFGISRSTFSGTCCECTFSTHPHRMCCSSWQQPTHHLYTAFATPFWPTPMPISGTTLWWIRSAALASPPRSGTA